MGALVHIETPSLAVTPGVEAVWLVRVRNSGKVIDQFSIEVLGDAQGWARVDPPLLSLFPNSEESVRVTFKPPRSAHVPAGAMPIGLRVRSSQDPPGSVIEEGVLHIAPFYEVKAELAPLTSRGSRTGEHELIFENVGNAPVEVRLAGLDPERALEFEISPPVFRVRPADVAQAAVLVRPRQTFWRGAARTHHFSTQVSATGSQPIIVRGVMAQEQLLPKWLPTSLAGTTGFVKMLLKNIPALLFVGVLIPLGIRLALQRDNSPLEVGHPLRSFTDIFAGPFYGNGPPAFDLADWAEQLLTRLELATSWTVLLALAAWTGIWFVALIGFRLFKR